MKRDILLIACFCMLLIMGCKKSETLENNPPPPPPPPPPTDTTPNPGPLRIVQSIYTHDDNGTLVNDTTSYTYDDEGRVKTKVYPFGVTETYTYSGDSLISIKQNDDEILRNHVNIEDDSFTIDFLQSSGAIDTVRLTYLFDNNRQTEFWTYLHFIDNGCGCMPENSLQKERKYYNGEGNLTKTTLETPPDHIEGDQYTVTAWDDKKNPKVTDHPINALALALPIPLESYSLHNPTSYYNSVQTYEVEMTYNDEGYPLTYKYKNQDLVFAQLIYNR